jgi:hypothetical protein
VSHSFEDLPPPWSGRAPRPPLEVLRAARPRFLLAFAGLVLVSIGLEWWASFRVLGMQLDFVLVRLGRRRSQAAGRSGGGSGPSTGKQQAGSIRSQEMGRESDQGTP